MDVWVTIHMVRSLDATQRVREILTECGYLVKTKAVYRNVSEQDNYFEIAVLKSEAEEARALLLERGL